MTRLGLIAGNGRFPLIFTEAAQAEGVEIVAVAHEGETPEDAVAGLWLSLNQRVEEESGALPLATSPNPTRKLLGLLSTVVKRR